MVESILLGVAFIIILILLIRNKTQYQKGSNDLLSMFLKSGYDMKINMFETLNQTRTDHGIVFIGDSITQDYNMYEFFPKLNVYNRGIGGDTTIGLFNRLKVSVDDLNPDKVIMLIGTNDFVLLNHSLEMIRNRIQDIIKNILQNNPSTTIYLLSILPVNPNINHITVGNRNNHDIKTLNNQLAKLNNVHYIDVHKHMVDAKGVLLPSLTYDGLHLNHQGYEKLTELLKPYLIQ